MVIFDPLEGFPDSGGKPFWTGGPEPPLVKINTRVNWFRNRGRPGPKSHPVQPVLMEFKFSQVPTVTLDGYLALAMHPSVALWNPYNVRMSMEDLYVEVPIHKSEMHTMNPKEYDRWRKWYMWSHAAEQPGGGGGISIRPAPGISGKKEVQLVLVVLLVYGEAPKSMATVLGSIFQ